MNSSKMLRIGMPILGLCVFSVFISGCRSVVLADRPSVPPAERELAANEEESNASAPAPAAVDKSSEKDSAKAVASKDSEAKFVYPRFEDTDHTPIYSASAKTKKSSTATAAFDTASTYIVRRGDSLSKIASRHHVRTIDLAKANNLQLTSVIRVGQKLTIPGGKAAAEKRTEKSSVASEEKSAPRSGLYVVRRGDSISRIAKRCKVKRADLMAVNNINENTVLRIGQTLKLPGAQVVNETSVIVDTATEDKAEETAAPATKTESSVEADVLKELGSDAAAADKASASAISAENASATAAEAVAAEKNFAAPAVAEGGPVSIQQDVNIDDFCKAHNVSKDELIRLNSAITESTVSLKKGDVIILP